MTNPKVDFYFTNAKKWRAEIEELRTYMLDTGLNEELKWGCPCYTKGKSNVVLIHTFKDYCALLFFKGALMSDSKSLLIQQSENVQSTKQMRFTDIRDVVSLRTTIAAYVKEAIRVEDSGEKVELKKTSEYAIPEELTEKFRQMPDLKKAFYALTPGRQRSYLLHFGQAKQSSTRLGRIEKFQGHILAGKGMLDV
jgi:uncharacterized protein YdeI (YjbR/CyaY-like superfamily)